MCMLTYFPPRAEVNVDRLRNGSITNNDGHGWAVIHTDGLVILTGHSMTFDEALEGFVAARLLHPNTDAMFHSRYTTHGLTNLANCHPFTVPKLRDTVVAHNGVLPCHPLKGDLRSDTRLFAEDILRQRFPALDSPKTMKRLEQWMGYNKILILTVDPRYRLNAYLVKGNLGEWVDGVWYSNSGYEKKKPWSGYVSSGRWVKSDAGDWRLDVTSELSTIGTGRARDEYDSWDEYWDEQDRAATARWRSAREKADELAAEADAASAEFLDAGDISLPLVRDGSAAYFYSADGREGAVLGPREPGARERRSYIPERWQCPDDRCQSFNIDAQANLCLSCNGCLTCAEHVAECGCDGDPVLAEIEATEKRIVAAVAAFREMGIRVSDYMQDIMREMSSDGLDRVILRVRALKLRRDDEGDTVEARSAAATDAVNLIFDISKIAAETSTGWPTSVPRAIEAAPASGPGILTSLGVDGDAEQPVTVNDLVEELSR